MKRSIFLLLAAVLFLVEGQAQQQPIRTSRDYPQGYFRNPLNIVMDASGTFGELRSTHFHAGDDYRTQQRIGLPLHAAAAGYVSRVRVQIGGGGLSLYIDHPNGYTTTYLHMDQFNKDLTEIVRAEQYLQKRFDVDINLPAERLPLAKGDYIGTAGNTGGSGGPHLHFEIRDTKTQNPLNPQLFGLRFPDNMKPTISRLMVYDLNDNIFDEYTPRKEYSTKAHNNGTYSLNSANPIVVAGKFGLAISSIDRHRAGGFQNGVYSIELFIDGKAVSTVLFEELDFRSSRGIHAYIDYAHWKKTKVKFQKSFKDPGNPIEIFKNLHNNGIIRLDEARSYAAKYVVKDVAGNCSELNFTLLNTVGKASIPVARPALRHFSYQQENTFDSTELRLRLPQGVLYGDLAFQYHSSAPLPKAYSQTHHVHNAYSPLFQAYNLAVKATTLPPHLHEKALIASVENGAEGGSYADGWVSVNTRNFGRFYIAVDTVAPTISPRNIKASKNIVGQRSLDFTISDNLSGIQSFEGYLNDQWVLMEYDAKNKHLWYRLPADLPAGKLDFKLLVTDWKNNQKIYQSALTR